jgi:hypothetical protein
MNMKESIIIVVKSDKEKEYGQHLKNILSKTNTYEANLLTAKQFTDNEPQLSSSQKVIFIGENDVSKRNLSSIEWKFSAPNMKYGWIGSVALLTVGNTLLTIEDANDFNDMCETLKNDVKTRNIKGTSILSAAFIVVPIVGLIIAPFYLPLFLLTGLGAGALKFANDIQKELKKQRKEQYKYLLSRFVLKDIDNYIGKIN